jgi:hypothetical protein
MRFFKSSRFWAYFSLLCFGIASIFVFRDPVGNLWPWTFILVLSAYAHGVAWGYLWRARGKLTWL